MNYEVKPKLMMLMFPEKENVLQRSIIMHCRPLIYISQCRDFFQDCSKL